MMRALLRVSALMFFSGMCALIYQVTWQRELRLIFGASTAASAAVLAVFLGGLGVGGAVLGRRADASKSPLGFYAKLEIIVAVASGVTPILVTIAERAYAALGGTVTLGRAGGTAVRLVLSILVLGAPTFAMGGTLPAAARAVESDKDAGRRALSVLYGVNTLGAVVGAALANFVMLEVFGDKLTLWIACLVNLLVGVVARATARSLEAEAPSPSESAEATPAEPTEGGGEEAIEAPAPARFILLAAGVVGFAFLLMELVWYRMLGPLLGGSSYTFGLILAVALLGIGVGGAAYAAWGGSIRPTLAAFAITCALEALFVIVPFALGDRVALLALFTRPLSGFGFAGLTAHWTIITSIAVLPASIVAGFQFPLLIALLGRGRRDVGRDVGRAYAANTAGSILGSLAGGFGLIPALGAPGCWRLVAVMLALLGAASLALAVRRHGVRARLASPVAALAATALLLGARGPTAAWRHSPIGAGRADQVLRDLSSNAVERWLRQQRLSIAWDTDGVESSVAMNELNGRAFIINGKSDGAAIGDAGTQIMSGLLGAALHPQVKRALVVGLGTGSTAGWLGVMPGVERVDVVEIEPAILRVARDCAPVNADVLSNPKVSIFIGDAREVLSTTRQRYDLVFSEPSNPFRAGISSLYTAEFYRGVASRLDSGGIFIQWLQSYEIDGQAVRTAITTVSSVFSDVSIWLTQGGDLLLVATAAPLPIDAERVRARVREEPLRSAMMSVFRSGDLEGLLAHHVARPDLAREIARQDRASVSTDDRNLLEFAFAQSVGKSGGFQMSELWDLSRALRFDRPDVINGDVDWDAIDDMRAVDESLSVPNPRAAPDRRLAHSLLERYRRGDLETVKRAIERGWPRIRSAPEDEMIAEVLASAGDERAIEGIERVRVLEPPEADAFMARLRASQGKLAEAAGHLEAAFISYRTRPFADRRVMARALDLALDLARKEPPLAPRLFAALREPFAVSALGLLRTTTAFWISTRLPDDSCVRALGALEPNVPWVGELLEQRAICYAEHADGREKLAKAELRAFLAGEPGAFSAGLDSKLPEGAQRGSFSPEPAQGPRGIEPHGGSEGR